MARLGLIAALAVCLLNSAAMAGTSQGSFTVGIRIGKAKPHKPPKLRYTWGAAAIGLARAGFENPRRIEASGEVYWFSAERTGSRFRVAVWVATGEIAVVVPA